MLPNEVALVAIPDSGYFPEWYAGPGTNGKVYRETMEYVYNISKPVDTLPQECIHINK